jgi:triphosphatase
MELELGLDPEDAPRLSRLAVLAPLRSGRARSRKIRNVWHDSPDRALAGQGLAVVEQGQAWRLERLLPDAESWPPGRPAPVLASGRNASELGHALPQPLVPIAALEGRATSLNLATEQGPVSMTLVSGTVRAVASERRISRVRLAGPPEAVQPLAVALAAEVRLAVPCATLAAAAAAIASGTEPAPRHEGAPELPPGLSVGEAFAHVVGHLSDVILYFAPKAAGGHEGPEPVHQMRVAVRRLRSAIKVFRREADCPGLSMADQGLKALAARLAPTRDWDVFATETAVEVADAFPAEPRLRRLLGAVERRRRACHNDLRAFLGGAEFRRLGIELACLADAPAQAAGDEVSPTGVGAPLTAFAAHVLDKRLKRLLHSDDDVAALEATALHAIRLRAKRLRYAAEIFTPLYPAKSTHRFIRRLSRLQDRLGTMNDGAVAATLLGELGNGNHAFAIGLILGFVGARNRDTRARIDTAWRKFHRLDPFWE